MSDIKGYCCTQKCENDCNKCPYFSMSYDEVVMLCDKIRADAIEEFKNFIRSNKHYFVGDMAEMLIYEFEQMQLKEQKND